MINQIKEFVSIKDINHFLVINQDIIRLSKLTVVVYNKIELIYYLEFQINNNDLEKIKNV